MERSNKDLNEQRLGASHGSRIGSFLSDAATGSPVIEIGYNQFQIAVPEKVDMATYQ